LSFFLKQFEDDFYRLSHVQRYKKSAMLVENKQLCLPVPGAQSAIIIAAH